MRSLWLRSLAIVGVVSCGCWPLGAQTRPPRPAAFAVNTGTQTIPVVDPTTVEFSPSSDHADATILTRYDLELYKTTTPTVIAKTQSLGKPAPVGGLITYTALRTVTAGLPAGDYHVKIAAVGPGGVTRSADSNPFTMPLKAPAATGVPVVR